ncbi:hypothetical protein QJQ45_008210 [Haematococcus lacustris]|nr:hypothetical protein QJQ45_008210 [Haematococcus lacustris]
MAHGTWHKHAPYYTVHLRLAEAAQKQLKERQRAWVFETKSYKQVFHHLAHQDPSTESCGRPWHVARLPWKQRRQPHLGLRAYPFLGQALVWQQLTVDWGHELVTAIHMPLAFASSPPSIQHFAHSLSSTKVSASKVLDFIMARRAIISHLTISNVEAFSPEEVEGEGRGPWSLSLAGKHDFQASHLGALLMLLRGGLQGLRLHRSNDLMRSDQGLWGLAALCTGLTSLALDSVTCPIPTASAAMLSRLPKLQSLVLGCEQHSGPSLAGLAELPPSWLTLTALTALELRDHGLLGTLPSWLSELPALRLLDVSGCCNLALQQVTLMTQLNTLVLQRMGLTGLEGEAAGQAAAARHTLPDLAPLAAGLRSLSLAGNSFKAMPSCLGQLLLLEVLDLSGNKDLAIVRPLAPLLTALPRLQVLDARGIHVEPGSCWSEAKCRTMAHLASGAKLMRRRPYPQKLLMDA